MVETGATRLIDKPNGSQAQLLRCALLSVVKGPDRGSELRLEQPVVRVGTGVECELRLSDPAVSRRHLELRATGDGFVVQDLASTNGTLLGDVQLRQALLTKATTLRLGATTLRISPTKETVELPLSRRGNFGALIGASPTARRTFAMLERAATTDSTVLLLGESGTGKELAAEAIHRASARAAGPFIVVDCASIPATLIESELFGHERGAFTGADRERLGALEEAAGGTLFLDEVGDLPLEQQSRLLRLLETQQVKRVGASRHRSVDLRVVAATNRHLLEDAAGGRFRTDLYYRLAVIQVELPPLRERAEDIVLLAHHFAERFVRDPRTLITTEIAALLTAYHWPGNVRELRNTVERLAVLPDQAVSGLKRQMQPAAEPNFGTVTTIGRLADLPFHQARAEWQERFERQYLETQLQRADGIVSHAAQRAELPRQSFHRLLRRHGLKGR